MKGLKEMNTSTRTSWRTNPSSLSRRLTPLEFMEWISEMEMVFNSYDCNDRQERIFVARQLKTRVLSWWKLLGDSMPNGEERKMLWENFIEKFHNYLSIIITIYSMHTDFTTLDHYRITCKLDCTTL